MLRRRLRKHVRAVAVLLAALAMVLVGVRSGTRFFYCPISHHTFDSPPCSEKLESGNDSDEPVARAPDCCEEQWRGRAPPGFEPQTPRAPTAPLVAILSPPQFEVAVVSAHTPLGFAPHARAGPLPPSASERRARLMVFHL